FPIIEDAAHAVDSKIDNQYCGSFGKVGIYSFDSIKNIAAGEAGGLTATDESMMERAKKLRYCGIGKSGHDQMKEKPHWWEYDISEVFPKMMPNDLNAAVALAQLNNLEALQQ